MRFRSKPTDVEAIRWTGSNAIEVTRLLRDKTRIVGEGTSLELLAGKDGAQEWVPVPVGHWLVHLPDDLSDVWPVDNDYMQNKYEEITDAQPE